MPIWAEILILVVVIAAAMAATAFFVHEHDRKKVEYMLDAFEDGEYNFKFTENKKFNRTLNRIKWIVDRRRQQNEEESWTKLIRVLTHEIMNTVSPIASLSDALKNYLDSPDGQREADLRAGLQTISASSKDLIRFVESYREFTGVARPVKKALMVKDLIEKSIDLTSEQCSEAGAVCTYSGSDDLLIYADNSQISRIIINLIKNAVQAGAKQIKITASLDEADQTLISVKNDGSPISLESQDQIFIPFFTTKSDGSGIGLSLSRQIMRAHNGTLELVRSDARATEFLLTFK